MRILYLPCHSVHEYDEVRMFHEMGYEIFSPGAYFDPQCSLHLRPGIPGLTYDQKIIDEYDAIGSKYPGEDAKYHLTKEFVDNFDVVIVMSLRDWVEINWDAIKHKKVILRTNGQGDTHYEDFIINKLKEDNFYVVRYSPQEEKFPNYGGSSATIRFGKKMNEYPEWVGDDNTLCTLVQNMAGRDIPCNWHTFKTISENLKCTLYGMSNESAGDLWYGRKTSFDETMHLLKQHRAYFYAGTKPANYTLNFMEALAIGLPIVAVGKQLGNLPNLDAYEIPYLISQKNGIVSDNVNELIEYTKFLFDNKSVAEEISKANRSLASELFADELIKSQWKSFFDQLNF